MKSTSQKLVFINALLFLVVLPWSLGPIVEVFTRILIFSLTITNMISAYRKNIVWVAFYFCIIALFYNPWFLKSHQEMRSFVADIALGLSLVIIGIYWDKISVDRRD